MKTSIYLVAETFAYNGQDTDLEVKHKLICLINDFVRTKQPGQSSDCIFRCDYSIWETKIWENEDLQSYIFSKSNRFDGDEKALLTQLFANVSQEATTDYENLKSLCKYRQDETEIIALLVLNAEKDTGDDRAYMQFDNYQIVYDRASWLVLQRQILGNHPGNPEHFIEEAKKCFSNLLFHDNCITGLSKGEFLSLIPRKIVYYLSILNDKLSEIKEINYPEGRCNPNDLLADISGRYGLDKGGSVQANSDKKRLLTFKFIDEGKKAKEKYCELHLKITSPDRNYRKEAGFDEKHFNARIYFAIGEPDFANGKHLIGQIGPHV